ncbi:MAG: hypothetical protein ACI35P_10790 [Bacillus sp. (in: firmicutes)]
MYYFYNSPYIFQFHPHQVGYPLLQTNHLERQLPPSEPQSLKNSAENIKPLLIDVGVVNERIINSPTFAQEITSAAQKGNHQAVHHMINNLDISNNASVSFSPGGILITYTLKENDSCYITTFLNWKAFF